MLHPLRSGQGRAGVILLVVLALLTLFAALGVAFVLYAETMALAAEQRSAALTPTRGDVDPDLLLAYFLGQFLFDAPDDAAGVYSALRGHSLGRSLYGGNGGPASRAGAQPAANLVPFSGTGRLDGASPFGTLVPGPDVNDAHLINYTYYPADAFVRDPERLGWRADLAAARGPFAGGWNAPYTYPDLNSTFLAAVRADGSVLLPSFHRPWAAASAAAGTVDGEFYDRTTGQLNSLWSAQPGPLPPWFKYTTLRPLPALNPGFPPPEDGGGDVKNLAGPGTLRGIVNGQPVYWQNDSFWIDLDFPVLTDANGRRFKPLFAPLVLDLDNRINVNVASAAQQRVLGQAPNRLFPLADMEALLRRGDLGATALSSALVQQFPSRFATARARQLVTTASFDLGSPGTSPWIHDPAAFPYEALPTVNPDYPEAPQGPAIHPPTLTGAGTPPTDPRLASGEFGPLDWRAVSAALGRVDLQRPLPPYPHQGSGLAPPFGAPLTLRKGRPVLDIPFDVDAPNGPIWQQFVAAHTARQRLADDIYRRLLAITGVPPLHADQNPTDPPADLLRPRRWLAQLAANLVDFLDEDDISTPLLFYTAEDYRHLPGPLGPPDPTRAGRPDTQAQGAELQWPLYWVFGTELPRVLLNEVLPESGHNDPHGAYLDRVRVFLELYNPVARPLVNSKYQPNPQPIPLHMGQGPSGYSPYQVLLGVKSPVPLRSTGAAVLPGNDNDNVLGNPEPGTIRQATSDADFSGAPGVTALGFQLLGPPRSQQLPFAANDPFTSGLPKGTAVLRAASLTYGHRFTSRQPGDPPDERDGGVAVVLRRLANPYLPFDGRRRMPNSTDANFTYNPYLTVDYVEGAPLQPVLDPAASPLASTGKLQPFAAFRDLLQPQIGGQHPTVRCTFGGPNLPAPASTEALTHLDRPPLSPLELLAVSGYQPYQLTQRFIGPDRQGALTKFGHRAPWLDEDLSAGGPSHRLYRLFEFLEASPAVSGYAPLGRRPGKVNLNTVWDPEIFRALGNADPTRPSTALDDLFSGAFYDATTLATTGRRTPGLVLGLDDLPFKGYAAGEYPAGSGWPPARGLDDSLLRLRNLGAGASNLDLLTSFAGQVTARSNVFAVWLTVGFFEVTDTITRPARLGAEIGQAEGRQVRHRMFALVDRTNLSIASCVTALRDPVPAPPPAPTPLVAQTLRIEALEGTLPAPAGGPGIDWKIAPGTLLVVDAGADQETVEVVAVNSISKPPTIRAVFTKAHAAGAAVSLAGVPGLPPVFLQPRSVTGPAVPMVPPFRTALPYRLTVQLAVDPNRSDRTTFVGQDGATPWALQPGSALIIDVGPNQEVVTVGSTGFAFDRASATGSFEIVVTRPHAEGFRITNTFLGNPGPYLGFDRRHPGFTALVPYRSIIQ